MSCCCQNRPRLFIVGIAKGERQNRFQWPKPCRRVRLKSVLDTSHRGNVKDRLAATAQRNLKVAEEKFQAQGVDIHSKAIVVDIAASPSRPNSMRHCLPCLTASRGACRGFYITGLKRQITMQELMRAQGFDANLTWQECMSERQFGHALGNSMTVTVMEHLCREVLKALGM